MMEEKIIDVATILNKVNSKIHYIVGYCEGLSKAKAALQQQDIDRFFNLLDDVKKILDKHCQ
jgi:hypothetical protein